MAEIDFQHAAPAVAVSAASSLDFAPSLADLSPGEDAEILGVTPDDSSAHRLLALGFTPGAAVCVRRVAPLRDPVEYRVRGAFVSLRRADAARIAIRRA